MSHTPSTVYTLLHLHVLVHETSYSYADWPIQRLIEITFISYILLPSFGERDAACRSIGHTDANPETSTMVCITAEV